MMMSFIIMHKASFYHFTTFHSIFFFLKPFFWIGGVFPPYHNVTCSNVQHFKFFCLSPLRSLSKRDKIKSSNLKLGFGDTWRKQAWGMSSSVEEVCLVRLLISSHQRGSGPLLTLYFPITYFHFLFTHRTRKEIEKIKTRLLFFFEPKLGRRWRKFTHTATWTNPTNIPSVISSSVKKRWKYMTKWIQFIN